MPAADPDPVLRWSEDRLRPSGPEPCGVVLTADSFLVDEGAVRGYERHWARFGGCCAELGVATDVLAGFRRAVEADDPTRRALVSARRARDGLRGARRARADRPPATAPAYRRAEHPRRPRRARAAGRPAPPAARKGPDLATLVALRAGAVAAGVDELVLRDDDGRLVEGALHSLLWWEEETLCTTPAERTLPGVTRALLLDIAGEHGRGRSASAPRGRASSPAARPG